MKSFKRILSLSIVVFLFIEAPCLAQGKPNPKDSIPEPVKVQTHHSVKIGAQTINYTATVGTIILKDNNNKPIASFGYTAYTKDGETDMSKRPLTFSYNGGPGSSSIWLHMGAVGPKRVVLDDPNNKPSPPYQLADNNSSIVDITDLVMVDPVGTGVSRPVGKATGKDFWGVDEDIRSVGNFIAAYIKENDRWNSPKFLLGESYGTTRSAGIADYLQEGNGIALNGVILVSTVLNFNTLIFSPANDLPYIMFFPTYAAVAYFHDKLPQKPSDLTAFLQQARDFAGGEYKDALFAGNNLSADKRKALLSKLHQFTGLSEDYWDKANLRVSEPQFTAELLRDEGKTTGRLDARYAGITQDKLGEYADYDPQSSAISPPYTSLFMNYYFGDLKAPKDLVYNVSAYTSPGFNWNWQRRRSFGGGTVNTGEDLADAMTKNPQLKILVMNGYYDLATPFYGAEYTFDHMGLPDNIRKNVTMKYYEAGHMMYIHKESLPAFKADVAAFMQSSK